MEEHCWASQQWHPEFCHTCLGTDPKKRVLRCDRSHELGSARGRVDLTACKVLI